MDCGARSPRFPHDLQQQRDPQHFQHGWERRRPFRPAPARQKLYRNDLRRKSSAITYKPGPKTARKRRCTSKGRISPGNNRAVRHNLPGIQMFGIKAGYDQGRTDSRKPNHSLAFAQPRAGRGRPYPYTQRPGTDSVCPASKKKQNTHCPAEPAVRSPLLLP